LAQEEKAMSNLQIKHMDRRNLVIGVSLVLLSLLMPNLVNVENFQIYEILYQSIATQERVYIIYAALKLVALNAIRCIPHYVGAFFIGESIEMTYKGRPINFLRALLICTIIPIIYFLIGQIYHIRYDFGGPALMLIAMLVMLEKINFNLVNLSKKTLMVILMIISLQLLDVMPDLDNLPFGRGETSTDIKVISHFMEADTYLQFAAMLLFFLLFSGSILMCKLILDENNLRQMNEIKEQNEKMHTEQRLQAMEERTQQELRHLVHDLKTPLTSAQALVSVVKLSCPQNNRELEYLTRVENSMDHMSSMISEVLYENRRSIVTTEHITRALLAQISNAEYAVLVHTCNSVPEIKVEVNEIRFLRALINLIENSYYALEPDRKGDICVLVTLDAESPNDVCFQVKDNGKGIPEEILNSIWEDGFSTRNSHGLGLSFVRQVVEQNHGTIEMTSEVGKGSIATIRIPESEENHA
jgi:signal transduction histidine kinase